jgi:anaerobic selenocysteine-containing dehydrogenase
MINEKWLNDECVRRHTAGFEELRQMLEQISWEELETGSGVTRDGMREFARTVAESERAVFVWGMGITQHACGEDNVHAIINLALAKGFVGCEGCGLMPIRGHSGVQVRVKPDPHETCFRTRSTLTRFFCGSRFSRRKMPTGDEFSGRCS